MREVCESFKEGTGQGICATCGQSPASHAAMADIVAAGTRRLRGDERAHCLTVARERLLASFNSDETTEAAEQHLADLIERERADACARLRPRSERERRLQAELAEWQAWAEDVASIGLDQTDPAAVLPDDDRRVLIRENCHDLVIVHGALEKAEAAAGQMRPVVDASVRFANSLSAKQDAARHDALIAAVEVYEAHGATDAGRGWVSPEAHAEVVRERDEARRVKGEYLAAHVEDIEAWSKSRKELRDRAEKAEARVALLEAVAVAAGRYEAKTHGCEDRECETCTHRGQGDDEGHVLREALAALDAAPTSGPRGGL